MSGIKRSARRTTRIGALAGVALLCLIITTGCARNDVPDKKAIMGGPLTPAQQAEMTAAVKQQQVQTAAAAKAAATPHGPGAATTSGH